MKKLQIVVYLDDFLLQKVDEQVLKAKYSPEHSAKNRSQFVEEALHFYLKNKFGLPYMFEAYTHNKEKRKNEVQQV